MTLKLIFGCMANAKASDVVIMDPNSRHNPGVEQSYTDQNTGKAVYVNATAMEQSRLNKIAAFFTCLSVLFQAVAAALCSPGE